ncbi:MULTISPECIES: 16S rRNA (guanine(966)-N(2))-methyltransferase RsmD [Methylomonas]|uniref:16S rRNA (guanine(966)-N(2))-methyltransferase RsmD n=1 Tax=Methylomonas TaxID=416 RepID=UPI0012321069|nr:16S rRNA (guanine(966)-N(2))-methyltransferase RsmD [Methylomonas rhizoryzae]
MSNQLRIIGGEWRSRVVKFDDAPGLRPTPARVRETLFNWLRMQVEGSRCLDLFAGSGALGFEAASRGARHVTLVDSNSQTCRKLRENLARFHSDNIEIVQADAETFLKHCQKKFDLVFLDPPFNQSWIPKICQAIAQADALSANGIVYLEFERDFSAACPPPGWDILKSKLASDVGYGLIRRTSSVRSPLDPVDPTAQSTESNRAG